jgi:hypothetical protein
VQVLPTGDQLAREWVVAAAKEIKGTTRDG